MNDFSQLINLLESARQLAQMNDLPMLSYLIEIAKSETRENKDCLRRRRRGQLQDKDQQSLSAGEARRIA